MLCYNLLHMPSFNSHKKRGNRASIDGMVPAERRQIRTPEYYRGSAEKKEGFTPIQANRRRPHHHYNQPRIEQQPVTNPNPILGDFEQIDTGSNFGDLPKNLKSKPEKKQKKLRSRGRFRRWWKNRSRKFKVFTILLILALVGGGLFGVRLYSFMHSVFSKNVGNSNSIALRGEKAKPDDLNTEGDGRFNVLLLGRGGDENEAPDLTDTMMIASIDIQNQSASLLSIPRDTWVNVNGSNMKINAAFSTGKQKALYQGKKLEDAESDGIKTAINSVRQIAGVPIHKYALIDYVAFRDIVNALGGVDVYIPQTIYDGFTGWSFKAGQRHFDGLEALKFARSRHGSPRGDFDRNEHQRQLLLAMRDKGSSTGVLANPVKLNSIANAVQKNIRTDLSLSEAQSLYNKTKGMTDSAVISLDLAKPDNPLITTGSIGNQSVVRPVAGLFDYTKIRAYARSNMIDPFIKKEQPTVAVYNGSGKSGLATSVADVLTSLGYKVITKETSLSPQSGTTLVKKTTSDHEFTDRFLSLRFKTTITTTVPNGVIPDNKPSSTTTSGSSQSSAPNPDYIIVLGSNFSIPNSPNW